MVVQLRKTYCVHLRSTFYAVLNCLLISAAAY